MLKSPKNFRWTTPKVCATCKWFFPRDGWCECTRPNGPSFDYGDMKFWIQTCDRWHKPKKDALAEPVSDNGVPDITQ